nr:hypothetical protein CFP56_56498 [Quercus suber]
MASALRDGLARNLPDLGTCTFRTLATRNSRDCNVMVHDRAISPSRWWGYRGRVLGNPPQLALAGLAGHVERLLSCWSDTSVHVRAKASRKRANHHSAQRSGRYTWWLHLRFASNPEALPRMRNVKHHESGVVRAVLQCASGMWWSGGGDVDLLSLVATVISRCRDPECQISLLSSCLVEWFVDAEPGRTLAGVVSGHTCHASDYGGGGRAFDSLPDCRGPVEVLSRYCRGTVEALTVEVTARRTVVPNGVP